MQPVQPDPEFVKRDRSYRWAEACLRRAMMARNPRRAVRAATLMQALRARLEALARSRNALRGLTM